MKIAGWAPVLALLLVLTGCGVVNSYAERTIQDRAPELLGPADRYQADVRGASRSGVDYLRLEGINVRPAPDLLLDDLTLTLRGVRFQTEPSFHITQLAGSSFTGRISETAVNAFIASRLRDRRQVREVRITLQQDLVRVVGTVDTLGIGVPVTTTGRLVAEGNHINYQPVTVTIAGVGLSGRLRDMLANAVNPLVDLSSLRFTPRVEWLGLAQGQLSFSGTASVPADLL
ncbi:MAG: LmeA family phospholipid-binding protein [Armatimonadota bacterium]